MNARHARGSARTERHRGTQCRPSPTKSVVGTAHERRIGEGWTAHRACRARRAAGHASAFRIPRAVGLDVTVMLHELLAEIQRQGGYGTGVRPEPVASLELFFEESNDLGSIGCNLADHPRPGRFPAGLHACRDALVD